MVIVILIGEDVFMDFVINLISNPFLILILPQAKSYFLRFAHPFARLLPRRNQNYFLFVDYKLNIGLRGAVEGKDQRTSIY